MTMLETAAPMHTPGHWRRDGLTVIEANNGDRICTVDSFATPADEVAANLALIAAAPTLYEALADLLDQVEHSPGGHLFLTRMARRALLAAGGIEQQ